MLQAAGSSASFTLLTYQMPFSPFKIIESKASDLSVKFQDRLNAIQAPKGFEVKA